MAIKIKTTRKDVINQSVSIGNEIIPFDKNGEAEVDASIAANIINHPDYVIASAKGISVVQQYIDSQLKTPTGYDAGEVVRAHCIEYAGVSVTASDNQIAEFNAEGYALIGKKTAQALQDVVGESFTFEKMEKHQDDKPTESTKASALKKKPTSKPNKPKKTERKSASQKNKGEKPENIPDKIDV